MRSVDEARLNVWKRQSDEFFDRATIDMDGTLTATMGECKQGMDVSYKGAIGSIIRCAPTINKIRPQIPPTPSLV